MDSGYINLNLQGSINISGVTDVNAVTFSDINISRFMTGKTVIGEVLESLEGKVKIKLLDDTILDATVGKNVHLEAGKVVPFMVKNNGSQVTLSALFTNTSNLNLAGDVLKSAGIPENNENLFAAAKMIEHGLPVDRDSALSFFSELKNNSYSDLMDIISLHEINMPVNRDNLLSVNLLNNNQSVLNEMFSHFETSIDNDIMSFINTNDFEGLNTYINDLQYIVDSFSEENINNINATTENQDIIISKEVIDQNNSLIEENNQVINNSSQIIIDNEYSNINITNLEDINDIEHNIANENINDDISEIENVELTKEDINNTNFKNIINDLKNQIIQYNSAVNDINITESKENLLNNIHNSIKHVALAFKNSLKNNLTLSIDDFSDKKKIQSTIKKISESLNKISERFNDSKNNTELTQDIKNTQNNYKFINDVNKFFEFIQLPISPDSNINNGELYVYKNKKRSSSKDEDITAFLNLSTNHLGNVRVFISLSGDRINTDFKVESDEVLDLIEKNIHILDSHLQDKGFSLKFTAGLTDSDTLSSFPEKLKGNKQVKVLSQLSFDARA